ncbi:MAG: DUF1501 domain-containing protein [Planctomycetaceae bacterium]
MTTDRPRSARLRALESITRRHFLGRGGAGIGAMALGTLLNDAPASRATAAPPNRADEPLAPRAPHFAPKAKSVIYLHMTGSPPQQDLFDYKPKLNELNGQDCPAELTQGERFAFIKGTPKLLGTPHKFARRGELGAYVSDLLPNIASIVDDLTIIRSLKTDQFNHAPAQLFLYTGSPRNGRPSMGSWVTYGLGSESANLPGFVVLLSGGSRPDLGEAGWNSGFLPTVYQGVQCRSSGDPVLYLTDPEGMSREVRRKSLDAIADLNRMQLETFGDPETLTRIAQYEMAFRMQASVPEVMDISREPKHIHELYGSEPGKGSFANNCLLARRLVEQGVRFVQLFDWGWDTHGTGEKDDIITKLPLKCREMDRPVAGLIADLEQRGLLDDTLVIWGGEFGRTSMNEARGGSKFLGRDHHPHCGTMFLAGGGVKRGFEFGVTDELGYHVVEDEFPIHDLQATILHLLGIDHERLTHRFQGRDFRLTDVFGNVRPEILA